ncbi:MAG TPA: hypothetical protein DCO89_00365 [Clostridiales bacterium]|nr:hypothetical protein [Clostridiales bacterium]
MDNIKGKKFTKIFVIYFLVLAAFVFVRIASNFGLFNLGNEIVSDFFSTTLIQIVILFSLPFVLYIVMLKTKPKQMFKEFGYKKLTAKAILICFGLGILAYILNIFVSNFFAIILNYAGYNPQYTSGGGSAYDTVPKFLYGVLSVAILPAFCEEFLHRGLVLRGTSNIIGYKKAILLSSVLFGLMHLNISQFFYATILGILMGFVATMTRSIWPAIIIHFCNNFINVFVSFSESTHLVGFSFTAFLNSIASYSVFLFFLLSICIITVVLIGIVALIKKLFILTGAEGYNQKFADIESKIRGTSENTMTDEEVVSAFQRFVLPNMKTPNNIFDFYINDDRHYGNLKLKYKISLISCFVLASLVTIFTFIWGVI